MYTIGRLAKEFRLSRSTLIYYDRVGLFSPSGRSGANYRIYTRADRDRLEQICVYRRTGLPLAEIGKLLGTKGRSMLRVLERRLDALNSEISALRGQQHFIVRLLKNEMALSRIKVMDKDGWIRLLEASGLDEEARDRWHAEFERLAPDAHREFLESLGIPAKEVTLIRKNSRGERQVRNKRRSQ